MSELPKNWHPTSSGEICEYITSGSRDWRSYYSTHGPLFVRTQDINQDRLDLSEVAHVNLPEKVEGKRSRIQPGDLLVTITGANVGKVALVPTDIPEAYVSQSVGLMRLKDKRNGPYLHYYLQSDRTGRKQVLDMVYGIGRPVLSLQNLRDIPISLPPIPEQRRIVAEIEKQFTRLEAGVAALRRAQANIKRYRAAILKAACEGRLVPQDPKDAPVTDFAAAASAQCLPPISEEEIPFQLPESWRWCRLGSVAELINGDRGKNYPNRAEYVPSGLPFINTGHIEPNGTLSLETMHYLTRAKFDSLRSGKIRKGDLVYCLRGATLGKTAVVDQFSEGAVASSLVIIRLTETMSSRYAYYYLTSRLGKELIGRFDNGSAQPNLSANSVKRYVAPIPPLAEQTRIVAEVERRLSVVEELETLVSANLQRATRLRQSILQKAFTGQL